MLPDWVSNLGPLTYESGALPIALRGPATEATLTYLIIGISASAICNLASFDLAWSLNICNTKVYLNKRILLLYLHHLNIFGLTKINTVQPILR